MNEMTCQININRTDVTTAATAAADDDISN